MVLNAKGKVVQREKVPTCETKLIDFVENISGSKHLIMDETTITQWLYVLFNQRVDELVVTQSTKHSKAKTDFKEAEEHAQNLRVGFVPKRIFHSCDELLELRAITSGYGDLLKNIIAEKNRYKALFRQSAIVETGASFYRDFELINSLRTNSQRFVAIPLYERIKLLEKHKELYEKQFEANVEKHPTIKLLTSIPGIGPIRANQIVAKVVTPYRFQTKYKFFAYCMLVNHSQNSDGKMYGMKRPNGQAELKGIFKSSRLSVLKGSSALRLKYELMIENGSTQQAAYSTLARTIAAVVLGVWKSGKKYNDVTFRKKVKSAYGLAKI